MSTLTPAGEAKARQFADRVIADRAPAGEPVDDVAALGAFVTACRFVMNRADRTRNDLREPAHVRAWWQAVHKRAVEREIAATNRAVAAYDARQAG